MAHRQAYEDTTSHGLAVALGWFSIGLGLAELTAPRQVARTIGMRETPAALGVLQSYGAREIATGIAILSQPDNATWLWGRVAGDAVDLATLAGTVGANGSDRRRAAFAAAAVAGVAALDLFCAQQLSRSDERRGTLRVTPRDRRASRRAQSMDQAVTINAPIERVRAFCATPDQLPASIRALLSDTAGDSVITFRPAPGNRGTEVRVRLPEQQARSIFNRLARVVGHDVAGHVRDDLRKVKQLIEVGEVVISEGPSLRRAAQPATNPEKLRELAGV